MLQRRLFCTRISKTILQSNPGHNHSKWSVKQVPKSNFSAALEEISTFISDSDFIAVSLKNTGAYSAPWQRILPIDTAHTAYLKAKDAAERFQVLQFAVCPFSIRGSKLIVHPYNFHLFPRDELKIGMPSYSFSCQSSYLTSMAREGFDFNACIYDGISYLSRSQESAAIDRIGNASHITRTVQSPSGHTVADSVFAERIKSRVKHWISSCRDTNKKPEDALISSLRKIVSGDEVYGSRPCLSIDVCSERQVHLVLETLKDFVDVIPLLNPAKGGTTMSVRVVLTSSEEDKILLQKELQNEEKEHNKRIRGFREVIDLISASQKPVVAHNSLNDFTFVHSKFLAPLPSTLDEFKSSLCEVFPNVLDVNHLMKEISLLKKVNNLPASISYLKQRFFAPVDMEISNQAEATEVKTLGHDVLKISELFAKLYSILKIAPKAPEAAEGHLPDAIECYINLFNPCFASSHGLADEGVSVWTDNTRKISIKNLVFLWGFRGGTSAGQLKSLLYGSHEVFHNEFDVRLVDKSCAVVVFGNPGFSEVLLQLMDSGGICTSTLTEMLADGLTAAGYEVYQKVCELGLWEADLASSFERALEENDSFSEAHSQELPGICWNNDEMINLDDL
ncbi:PREDICTED: poly(A)-specific ribonuclease PARN-like isoform X2 [Nicotiana attenuata]|uniref:poly(A)-specific ribonuclease PARN-like isoform X2 n=1 Tax=Nicotiana attenuata TaxID=49451 RepID=UPI000905A353|nr:PREDICTED: poly(A)-specific ribonuclease PARN-like isoform X2 [Nicotiana attenuata]